MTHPEAEDYYASIRAEDPRLFAIEGTAMNRIRQWTGYESVNVGSFGLMLNLPSSDLDFTIGVAMDDYHAVCKEIVGQGCTFVAIRETRPGTVRNVYRFEQDGIEVDLAVMRTEDLQLLIPGLVRCRRSMSHAERVEHVFEKHRLKTTGDKDGYSEFKLGPYIEHCPGFSWLPLP